MPQNLSFTLGNSYLQERPEKDLPGVPGMVSDAAETHRWSRKQSHSLVRRSGVEFGQCW